MKVTISLILLFLLFSKPGFSQDSLCVHASDGNAKAKRIKMSVSFPCDWMEVESRPNDQILKFIKKDEESKILTSVSLDINDLPNGLTLTEAKNFLKPEILSDGTGEIVSKKSLTVDKINGSQIIRKDAKNNLYRSFNYFFYKNKLVAITYYAVLGSEVNVKDYFALFDSFLSKTKFK
jgi:hypothetical protein